MSNFSLLRAPVALCIRALASLARFDPVLRKRISSLLNGQQVQVAGGLLVWLLMVKYLHRAPTYSIFSLLILAEEREAAIRLCRSPRAQRDPRVVRESLLLSEMGPDDPTVVAYVRTELEAFLKPAGPKPAKPNIYFDAGKASVALEDIDQVFRSLGARMFLVSGTFLGAVREGRFLDSEYDIDVGFFDSELDHHRLVEALIKSSEFKKVGYSDLMTSAHHRTGVRVDVFSHFEDDGLICHGTSKHRWYNTPFSLAPITFEGREYLGPENADRYLSENYGNWRSPCAFWDYSFDTPNQRFPITKSAMFMLTDYVTESGDRYRAQSALIALRDRFGVDLTAFIPSGGSTTLRERLDRERLGEVPAEESGPNHR